MERSEELARIRHVETCPVVANEVRGLPVLRRDADLDASVRLLARELPGIAEEVLHDRREEARVAFGHQPVLDVEVDLP